MVQMKKICMFIPYLLYNDLVLKILEHIMMIQIPNPMEREFIERILRNNILDLYIVKEGLALPIGDQDQSYSVSIFVPVENRIPINLMNRQRTYLLITLRNFEEGIKPSSICHLVQLLQLRLRKLQKAA